jgi:uncharacterized protein involved in exopolysaccharide biosynthesis
MMIGLPVALGLIALGASYLVEPTFTASSSFVAERDQRSIPSELSGLAGQLGISVGTDASRSPQFYADLAMSREILDRLLLTRFGYAEGNHEHGDSAALLTLLRVAGRNAADSLERGARKLAGLLSVGVNAQTNIVTLRASLTSPELAAAVANRLVSFLNDFNTKTRQSQARERRKFAEQRVAAGEQDLGSAEEALKSFYQANRSWQQAPQLVFEEGRLRRQVDLGQELYVTLRRQLETARIEEVNDTPVITVIEAAVVPQRKSSPRRMLWATLAFVVGAIFAIVLASAAEYIDRARLEQQDLYRDVVSNAGRVRDDLSRTIRSIAPRFGPKKSIRP